MAKNVGINSLLNNSSYEILETGVRFKVFGISYPVSEEDLDNAIHFLMRLLERVQMIRKEKNDLTKKINSYSTL